MKRRLQNAAEGLHWVGPDGTILWANQTELDFLGYAHDEYVGHTITEFHVDRTVIDDILRRLRSRETLRGFSARLRHKDGSVRDVQINSNVLFRGEEFLHTLCFTRDVTETKAADELALRLSHIVEHSDDAIISKDLTGVICSWNPAAERMFGYTEEEAKGQSIRMIVPADRQSEEDEVLRRVRNDERVEHFDTVRRRKDGSSIEISLTVSPVKNREGRIVAISKIARDISHRKHLEAAAGFLVQLDDAVRPLVDAEAITLASATALGRHLEVNRCAYATVEEDQDSFQLTGNYTSGVDSIVGRYTFRQFGEECLRLMRAGEPYVVSDSHADPRVTDAERPSYVQTAIRAVICVPILKSGRFVAAMAVHETSVRTWHSHEVDLVRQVASRCWESIERARVTRELTESEHLFRALANSIANLAWMARPDGWIYWYNEQWYAYTGTTPEQMEGWGWERVHDPAMLEEVNAGWKHSIATGVPFEMVFPLRGADGEFRRFLTRVNPVRDLRGRVVHWFGTNTDVETERRATEANALLREGERLARQEAELQKQLLYSLFMQAPTLIAVLRGPDHVVELANPPLCQVWGHPEEALLNRSLFDGLPELADQGFRALLDGVYQTGVPYVGTETPATFRRTDGSTATLYFNFVYSPFRNIEGAIEGVFVIASEVTEQVRARNQVNDLRETAEAANRAKDEFLAMLGHELRNPLSPILTALHLMKLRDSGGERERTVIERQVNHLTRLVDDLLDVSRIARGKVELKEEIVEMAEVIARAIEIASPLLEERTHTLVTHVSRTGLAVKGDPTRLSQVVSNLLTNAAKYTPTGGRISVSAVNEGEEVVIRVRDSGIGIAPEELPRIFDLFVQERQALDRSQGGLGLGLAIVRNLIARHGGSISASSEGAGRGSEFVVRLPKAASALPVEPVSPSAVVHAEEPAAGLRILVVDDNEDAAEMLYEALGAKGHQVRVAYDGPSAVRVAEAFTPDVAFLDIGLPVMDGYELAGRLRQLPGLATLRLVALTGYGQDSDRQKSREAGFDHHLVKPIDFEAMETILSSAADR